MSAILGLVYWDRRLIESDDLLPILNALPPGQQHKIFISNNVALAYQTNQPSQSLQNSQPYSSNGYTIVADARIDNRRDILSRLSLPISEIDPIPDHVLILRAYQRWGADCLQYLIGDYAFAIWDHERESMFCGRDFIGARPFYYRSDKQLFAFCSNLIALSAFPDLELEIDKDEIFRSLLEYGPRRYYNSYTTFYRNLYRLPFAHYLNANRVQVSPYQYWHPPPANSIHLSNDAEYFERTQELLEEAILSRIPENTEVGSHISGGLDSSSISIIAARYLHSLGRNLSVYSWSPPVKQNPDPQSEQFRIEAICHQENLTCTYVAQKVELNHLIEFHHNQRMLMEHQVMKRAQTDNIQVMLSGWGGDEFISFNGRGYRADLFALGRWRELLNTWGWRGGWRKIQDNFVSFVRDVGIIFLPDQIYRQFSPLLGYEKFKFDDRCLEPEFIERLNKAEKSMPLSRYELRGRHHNQCILFENGHLTNRIEHWAADGARHGLVYTYPLLDRRLVEFAFAIPDNLYVRQGVKRYLFRHATAPLFPPQCPPTSAFKDEPRRLAHQKILTDFALKKVNLAAEMFSMISAEIPWLDHDCLRKYLAHETNASDKVETSRALVLVQLWHSLKQLYE